MEKVLNFYGEDFFTAFQLIRTKTVMNFSTKYVFYFCAFTAFVTFVAGVDIYGNYHFVIGQLSCSTQFELQMEWKTNNNKPQTKRFKSQRRNEVIIATATRV